MSLHYFDPTIAEQVGVNAAVVYQNILFWCEKNKANNKHCYDGLYWTYNTVKAWKELIPYLSIQSIRTALKKLEDEGLIKTGNFNKAGYDRTMWYASTLICENQQMDLPESTNGFVKNNKPIPDINTDNKPDSTDRSKASHIPYKEIEKIYNKHLPTLTGSRILCPKAKKNIQAVWKQDKRHRDLDFWGMYFESLNRLTDRMPNWSGQLDGKKHGNIELVTRPEIFARSVNELIDQGIWE